MLERLGLRVHLAVAFALTTALLGAAFGLVVGQWVGGVLDRQEAHSLVDLARWTSDAIDDDLAARLSEIEAAAAGIGDFSAAEKGGGGLAGWPVALPSGRYRWAAVVTADGVAAATDGSGGPLAKASLAQAPWFPRALRGPVVVAVPAAAETDRPASLLVAAPLRPLSHRKPGMLVVELAPGWLDALCARIKEENGGLDKGELLVVDGDGRPLQGAPLPWRWPALPIAEGLEQAVTFDWPDGRRSLTAIAGDLTPHTLSHLSWRVVARRDPALAHAPAERMQRRILFFAGLLTLAGAGMGALAAYRISHPLGLIVDAAERIRNGQMGVPIPSLPYFREVAMLSRSLAETITSLRRGEARLAVLNDELEQRVRERTGEVQRAHDDLAAQAAKLRAVIDTAIDGVMILRSDGRVETFNPACEAIFQWPAREIVGASAVLLVPEDAQPMHLALFSGAAGNDPREALGHPRRIAGRRRDGTLFPLSLSIGHSEVSGQSFYVVILRDVTEEEAAKARLVALATVDSLTGLRNRHAFLEVAALEFSRVLRHGRPLAILELDADHFKSINDGFGHAAGDAVLRRLGDVLRGNLREIDVVGRIGGEEFAVLMPDTDETTALNAAERLCRLLAEQVVMVERRPDLRFTVSIGVAVLQAGDEGIDDLLRRADEALYCAKAAGRNRVWLAGETEQRQRGQKFGAE